MEHPVLYGGKTAKMTGKNGLPDRAKHLNRSKTLGNVAVRLVHCIADEWRPLFGR